MKKKLCLILTIFQISFSSYGNETDTNYHKGMVCCALGNLFIQSEEYTIAKRWYQKSLEVGYNDPCVYFGRAKCERLLGNFTDAISHYTTVIKLFPKKTVFYFPETESYIDDILHNCVSKEYNKKVSDLIDEYVKAVKFWESHSFSDYIGNFENVHISTLTEDDILAILKGCVNSWNKITIIFNYGNGNAFNSNNNINLGEVYAQRALCKYFLDDNVGSIQDFRKGHKITKDSSLLSCYVIALNLYKLKQYKRTAEYCKHILKRDVDFEKSPTIYYLLGMSQHYLGFKTKSCENLRTAGDLGYEDAYEYILKFCN